MTESSLPAIEALGILLLVIASLVAILTRRLRLPYTVGLVLVGLALSVVPQLNIQITPDLILRLGDFQLTPELILGLLVPPLIFEAAFHLNIGALRRNLVTILAFAIPGVILTTFTVGGLVTWWTQIPFAAAILFGSLIAATDPVSGNRPFSHDRGPKTIAGIAGRGKPVKRWYRDRYFHPGIGNLGPG